jgi:hypothetical protein
MTPNIRMFLLVGVASVFVVPSIAIAAPDACSLLTDAQASAALGGTVAPGKPLASQSCHWAVKGKTGDTLLQLDVTVITPDRFAHMKAVTIGTVTSVSGLGDDAFYATLKMTQSVTTTLNVKKGSSAVTIRVSGGRQPVEEYQAKEKAAAMSVIPKL